MLSTIPVGRRSRAANPIHKVEYLYQDPVYVANITRGVRAHIKSKTGKSYEEVYGAEKAAEYREKLRAAFPARMAKFKRKVTEPELIVRGLLQQLGVEFVEQYPVGYHTVDFFVPSKLLVVQADGDYWHANPLLYPDEGRLSSAHRKQRGVDCSCNSYLLNHGYRVVRLWENDLHKKPEFCAEVLREALEMRIK